MFGSAPVIVEIGLRSVVLLVAAAAIARLWGRAPDLRHLVWSLSLAGLLLLPAGAVLLPELRIAVLPPPAAGGVTVEGVDPAKPGSEQHLVVPGPAAQDLNRQVSAGGPASPGPLVILWLAGALAFLGRLLGDRLRLARLVRRGAPPCESLRRELASLAGRLWRRPRLLLSAEVTVPSTWGLVRPVLVVPPSFSRWEPSRRRRILLHELAHVRRCDATWTLVARLATALFWWNPLAWYAARCAREASEAAADARVLLAGERPSDYARDLLAVARGVVGASWLRGLPGIGRGRLRDRIERVLEPGSPTPPQVRVVFAAAASTALLVAGATSALPVQATRTVQAPDPVAAAPAQRDAEPPPWPAQQVRWARGGEAAALFLEGDVDLASLVQDGTLPDSSGLLVWFHRRANGSWTSLGAGASGISGWTRSGSGRRGDPAGPIRALRRSLVAVAPDWQEHPDTSIGSLSALPEIADRPRLDTSGSVILGVPGSSRDPGTGVLQAGWYSGSERIGIFARGPLDLGGDGRSLEALPDDGWFAAFGWDPITGSLRLVEALPGPAGRPSVRHSVDGVERPFHAGAARWLGRVLVDLPGLEPGDTRISWNR